MKLEWGEWKLDVSLIEFMGAVALLFIPSPLKLIKKTNKEREIEMEREIGTKVGEVELSAGLKDQKLYVKAAYPVAGLAKKIEDKGAELIAKLIPGDSALEKALIEGFKKIVEESLGETVDAALASAEAVEAPAKV